MTGERIETSPNGGRRTGSGVKDVIRTAKAEMQELTGRGVIGVSAVQRDDRLWRLTLEVVELERVPATTSLLGSYDVVVDGDGHVQEYARTRRYHRNQADEASEL